MVSESEYVAKKWKMIEKDYKHTVVAVVVTEYIVQLSVVVCAVALK